MLTHSVQKITFNLLNCTAIFTIARPEVLLITQRKVFVKHITLIDKGKNKSKNVLNYQCC